MSFALRNDPRLRPETRARIKRLAARMGYTPDPVVAQLLARLRASKAPKYQATLALLNASPRRAVFDEVRTFGEWRDGARRRAAALGYMLDEFWLGDPGVSPARLARILSIRGIRAGMVGPLFNEGVLDPAHAPVWKTMACVVLGKAGLSPSLHGSRNDQFSTARMAVVEAARHGCLRPALVLSLAVDKNVGWRFSGGYHCGLSLCSGLRGAGVFDFDWTAPERFKRWLKGRNTDVLITAHAEVAEWVREAGIRVPAQIGLIHLDRNTAAGDWAGIDQNQTGVGAAAVDILVSLLHQNHTGPTTQPYCAVIPGRWREGGTLKSRRRRG